MEEKLAEELMNAYNKLAEQLRRNWILIVWRMQTKLFAHFAW